MEHGVGSESTPSRVHHQLVMQMPTHVNEIDPKASDRRPATGTAWPDLEHPGSRYYARTKSDSGLSSAVVSCRLTGLVIKN